MSCRLKSLSPYTSSSNISREVAEHFWPLLLKADSSSTATIWATVLISDRPAPDSTVVNFASTLGTVTSEAYTRAGLARAIFAAGDEPGTVAVVAQVLAVRDTVVLTVY